MSFSKVEGKFEILFCRSGCRRCSVKKGFLKTFVSFIGKHLCCNFFLIKLQILRPATLVKRGLKIKLKIKFRNFSLEYLWLIDQSRQVFSLKALSQILERVLNTPLYPVTKCANQLHNRIYKSNRKHYKTQPAFTCLKLTIETPEQGVKHVLS